MEKKQAMMAGTVIFVMITYALMIAAFYLARFRRFHIPVMVIVIITDVCFPFYLFMTRDWDKRLIDQQEIFSFLLWMHLMVVISLYVLYFMQIKIAGKLLKGETQYHDTHRSQGIGILISRGLVILTGALLVEPDVVLQEMIE